MTHISSATVRVRNESDRINIEPSTEFVVTPYVEEVTLRALAYLSAGYAVHFAGPPGVGKTSLAFHVAAMLGRPATLIHGDDEFGSSDLVGRDSGFKRYKLVDNFIHSVMKTEEEMNPLWVDNRLTLACEKGYTLIYDEFNRSKPEANNVLLSVLSERILNLPGLRSSGQGYLQVHDSFRAIFTSNPEEYAGVHRAQDALMDRMISITLDHYDRNTEVEITASRSGLSLEDSAIIVDIIRELRSTGVSKSRPTIRAAIAIARIVATHGSRADWNDAFFQWACRDVLRRDTAKVMRDGQVVTCYKVDEVAKRVWARHAEGNRAGD